MTNTTAYHALTIYHSKDHHNIGLEFYFNAR